MADLLKYSCPRCGCQISSSKSKHGITVVTFTLTAELAENEPPVLVGFPEARRDRWREATEPTGD